MIIIDKCIESTINRYLREHCDRQKKLAIPATAGFLIGSKLDDDYQIAHIAICAHPETALEKAGDLLSRMVDADWIADIGIKVLRLLPGGVDVVGLLWIFDGKSSSELPKARAMLTRAYSQILMHSNELSSLNFKPKDTHMALLTIEAPLGRQIACVLDSSQRGAVGVQTKVAFNQLEWIMLTSSATFSVAKPLVEGVWDFHQQFSQALRDWAECLFLTESALINKCSRARDELLRPRDRKSRGSTNNIFEVDLFLNAGKKNEEKIVKVFAFSGVDIVFDVLMRAAVPSKATVGQAIDAVKEHVVRSLCSRAVLHYESTDVVEDEKKDHVSLHQLPRSACAALSSQPAIIFSDFLFESDVKHDAQQSFYELLGIDVPEDEIDIDVERHLENTDLVDLLSEEGRARRIEHSSSSTSSLSSVIVQPIVSRSVPVNTYTAIAVLIAMLSFVIYLLMRSLAT